MDDLEQYDLERDQQFYEKRKLLTDDRMHLNARGHDEISRRITRELEQLQPRCAGP